MSYADYLTGERAKERLKDAVFVKCADCLRITGTYKKRCSIHGGTVNAKAPRICSKFELHDFGQWPKYDDPPVDPLGE